MISACEKNGCFRHQIEIVTVLFLMSQTLLLAETTYKPGSFCMLLSFHIMYNLMTRYIININAFDNCSLLFHIDQSFLYGNDLLNIEVVRTLMVFSFLFVELNICIILSENSQ